MIRSYPKKFYGYALRHKKITATVVILLILGFIFRPTQKIVVPTQKVEKKDLVQTVSVSGSIAATSINLSFPIGGNVTYVGVKKGNKITAGQIIATLDARITQKNLQSALIDYSKQRITFDSTEQSNQNRTPQSALNDAMKNILQNNQYDLDKSVNSVELQDLARQQSILTSPVSGILTRADVTTRGQVAGVTTIFTVTDPATIAFDMDVDQADIGKIKEDQQVDVILDAYSTKTLNETVKSIDFVSHTTINGGNAFTVETSLPKDSLLNYRVGMNGNADIVTGIKKNVLTIPLSSVVDDKYVYVQVPKGFVKKNITLGEQNDTDTEIISGLSQEDIVALDPSLAQKRAVK